ncbi:hypothetical protein BN946_scf184962.g46 [Trametes cinnabarina]|uniref:Heme haloperoxidase family profile domain-containing protein n=1 Tax=Pycnoporus cinnabarinus TaxID=5643 RepID=A0A060SI35_PYCCI|nr:hypothetical protein BN946_scf184962.g46 [Trametes cinnabarina]
MHPTIIFRRLLLGLVSTVKDLVTNATLYLLDFFLTLYNLVAPNKPKGHVIPEGHPGFGGKWPEYTPPRNGDSRCSCPALNAMANHGLIARDGKNIKFTDLYTAIGRVYNFSPAFCYVLASNAAGLLVRNYSTDRLDLSDLDAHNCIEHDASLFRECVRVSVIWVVGDLAATGVDSYDDPDQGKICEPLVEELLSSGTGPDGNLTSNDVSRLLGKRRVEAKRQNPKFSLASFHKMFGSFNGSTLIVVFGGLVKDLRAFLTEERLPDGWEPRTRRRMGLTMLEFNCTVFPMELSIKEEVDGSMTGVGQERYAGASDTKKID